MARPLLVRACGRRASRRVVGDVGVERAAHWELPSERTGRSLGLNPGARPRAFLLLASWSSRLNLLGRREVRTVVSLAL